MIIKLVLFYCYLKMCCYCYLNILQIWGSNAVNDLWIPMQQRICCIFPISHVLYSSICWFIKLRESILSQHSILCFPSSFFHLSAYNLVFYWATFVPSMSRMFVTPLPIGIAYWSVACNPLSLFLHLVDTPIQNQNYLLHSEMID